MKVQIIYTSLTGCTEKVARAIYDGLEGVEKSIHDLKDGIPVLDGDILLLGYWVIRGGPDEKTQKFLETIEGKAVGVFCTLGYYCDTNYGHSTLEGGIDLLKEKNQVIGGFVCSGAVASKLKQDQGKQERALPTEQKEIRWEIGAAHPTEAECALAAERFRERVYLYSRCRELNIPFTPII